MSKSIYDKVFGCKEKLKNVLDDIIRDGREKIPLENYPEIIKIDENKICLDIDQFAKEYPDTHHKYLGDLLDEYEIMKRSINKFFSEIHPYRNEERDDFFRTIDNIVYHLQIILDIESNRLPDVLARLKSEAEIHKQEFQKLEKLKPIEKILIIHYLKFDSLKNYQLGWKGGEHFISRLLDINPVSIKNPLSKLKDYTNNDKLTKSQALNIYPILEKVKSFFDNSELIEISKVIETRINELKVISGKD